MRLRNIFIGVLVGGAILASLFIAGKRWAKSYVPSQVVREWDHQVELEGGVKVRSPYELKPRNIPVPEAARLAGMRCNQFEGGVKPVNIITQVVVFPPGAMVDLNEMSAKSEEIVESRMGAMTDKKQLEREILGVPAIEFHGTLKQFDPPRRVRTLYFLIDRNFYSVNLSIPEKATESDSVWARLIEGIHIDPTTTKASALAPVSPPSKTTVPGATPVKPGPVAPPVNPSTTDPGLPPGMKRRNLTQE